MEKDYNNIETREKTNLMLEWISGKPAQPYAISLGPTDSCNLECLFCGRGIKNDGNELPEKKMIEIVHQAGEMGVKVVNISGGGEPFFRQKTTLKLLKTIKACGMGGGFTTNGTLFTEEIIKTLIRIEWDAIFFSVDGPDAETHDYLRNKKGVFNSVLKTLKCFKYLKAKLKRSNPQIGFQTVLVNKNYDKIGEIIKLAHKVGASRAIFIPVQPRNEWVKKLKLTERKMAEFRCYVKNARKIASKLGITTNLDDFDDSRLVTNSGQMDEIMIKDVNNSCLKSKFTLPPCFEPWIILTIYPDGRIGPCEQNVISHLDNRSLEEIWYHDKSLNRLRRQLVEKRLSEICSKCCEPIVMRNRALRNNLISCIDSSSNINLRSRRSPPTPIAYKS